MRDFRVSLGLDLLTFQVCETLAESPNKGHGGSGVCYMMDREIEVPEVEGKTIQSMRIALSARAETEIQIDFTDGTSFSSSTCPRIDFDAELYIGGSGEPQIVKKYGDD